MPFVPHTQTDVDEMLAVIDEPSVEQLFDEIPQSIGRPDLAKIPSGMNEMSAGLLMNDRASKNKSLKNFIGAGAYEHFIPAAVWDITSRGEFLTAYTPYQAEASQGTLQLIYEFQTMMTSLTAMDVSNASMYDGASALTEAVLMALRANKKAKTFRVLVPDSVHPNYRKTLQSIVKQVGVDCVTVGCDTATIDLKKLSEYEADPFAALIIPYPNFSGALEAVDILTDWAHQQGALVIAAANPTALALLKPPGQWGKDGADIVCGEAQPLGMPLASGGPYAGYMCCKQAIVRQMPGRIVGKTHDLDGKTGYVLTLQAREQHIRRAKATSNICTNQGLLVTAATIYMSLLGPEGLRRVAMLSHQNTKKLVDRLCALPGITQQYKDAFFHECVLHFEKEVQSIVDGMIEQGILPGFVLKDKNALLICVTETKTAADIDEYVSVLEKVMAGA